MDKFRPANTLKFRSEYTLKSTTKGKQRENLKRKQRKLLSISDLTIQLSKLLETNWEDFANIKVLATNYSKSNKEDESTSTNLDFYKILAIKLIFKAHAQNHDQFAFFTQLDIEGPEMYNCIISWSYFFQWSWVMREELNQLKKNQT